MRIGSIDELERQRREIVKARREAAEAERVACIKWLEQEAGQAHSPAHTRLLTSIIRDLHAGAHLAET